jgi:beta-N-acetylhexosaminidase
LAQTLEDKIGQMLLFGWQTDDAHGISSLNEHAKALIEEFRVGGLILMGRNVGPERPTRQAIREAQALALTSGLPKLLIATDQEGGSVARFGPPLYREFPSAKFIGDLGSETGARLNAAAMGEMLRAVEVNWALMPVLDVNNNPGNQVIGDRSYGDNPQIVAKLGRASVTGMQRDAHVMACGKHFPGHGDTDVDSHFALPIINHSFDRLDSVELPPFKAAIALGIGSIMTSHILFPVLDPNLPATLSPNIITGLLRRGLGYDGIVVTDCLEMSGVVDQWGSAEAAVLAAIAGADILLACHTETTQREIQTALLKAARDGRLTEERIEESNRRIRHAKSTWVN